MATMVFYVAMEERRSRTPSFSSDIVVNNQGTGSESVHPILLGGFQHGGLLHFSVIMIHVIRFLLCNDTVMVRVQRLHSIGVRLVHGPNAGEAIVNVVHSPQMCLQVVTLDKPSSAQ